MKSKPCNRLSGVAVPDAGAEHFGGVSSCVVCGEYPIPEGRQVCWECEHEELEIPDVGVIVEKQLRYIRERKPEKADTLVEYFYLTEKWERDKRKHKPETTYTNVMRMALEAYITENGWFDGE